MNDLISIVTYKVRDYSTKQQLVGLVRFFRFTEEDRSENILTQVFLLRKAS